MRESLKRELAKHTKEGLAAMLADLVDGNDSHDIRDATGLEIERCEEIAEAGQRLASAFGS